MSQTISTSGGGKEMGRGGVSVSEHCHYFYAISCCLLVFHKPCSCMFRYFVVLFLSNSIHHFLFNSIRHFLHTSFCHFLWCFVTSPYTEYVYTEYSVSFLHKVFYVIPGEFCMTSCISTPSNPCLLHRFLCNEVVLHDALPTWRHKNVETSNDCINDLLV